ncbi:unnamed protein product [Bemisia tabaci]|uniref:Uncharacterized protein n=2 Tax=Bemisia tabaci TaxID=7038 RepID=A0A9P0AEX9_BEMTA|nr:unnamed protein product [Bemisia tabaci]
MHKFTRKFLPWLLLRIVFVLFCFAETAAKMKLNYFCYCLSLQVGVNMLAAIHFTIAFIVLLSLSFTPRPSNTRDDNPLAYLLVYVYLTIAIIAYSIAVVASFLEYKVMYRTSYFLIFISFLYWLVLCALAFFGDQHLRSLVCIDYRCGQSMWLISFQRATYVSGDCRAFIPQRVALGRVKRYDYFPGDPESVTELMDPSSVDFNKLFNLKLTELEPISGGSRDPELPAPVKPKRRGSKHATPGLNHTSLREEPSLFPKRNESNTYDKPSKFEDASISLNPDHTKKAPPHPFKPISNIIIATDSFNLTSRDHLNSTSSSKLPSHQFSESDFDKPSSRSATHISHTQKIDNPRIKTSDSKQNLSNEKNNFDDKNLTSMIDTEKTIPFIQNSIVKNESVQVSFSTEALKLCGDENCSSSKMEDSTESVVLNTNIQNAQQPTEFSQIENSTESSPSQKNEEITSAEIIGDAAIQQDSDDFSRNQKLDGNSPVQNPSDLSSAQNIGVFPSPPKLNTEDLPSNENEDFTLASDDILPSQSTDDSTSIPTFPDVTFSESTEDYATSPNPPGSASVQGGSKYFPVYRDPEVSSSTDNVDDFTLSVANLNLSSQNFDDFTDVVDDFTLSTTATQVVNVLSISQLADNISTIEDSSLDGNGESLSSSANPEYVLLSQNVEDSRSRQETDGLLSKESSFSHALGIDDPASVNESHFKIPLDASSEPEVAGDPLSFYYNQKDAPPQTIDPRTVTLFVKRAADNRTGQGPKGDPLRSDNEDRERALLEPGGARVTEFGRDREERLEAITIENEVKIPRHQNLQKTRRFPSNAASKSSANQREPDYGGSGDSGYTRNFPMHPRRKFFQNRGRARYLNGDYAAAEPEFDSHQEKPGLHFDENDHMKKEGENANNATRRRNGKAKKRLHQRQKKPTTELPDHVDNPESDGVIDEDADYYNDGNGSPLKGDEGKGASQPLIAKPPPMRTIPTSAETVAQVDDAGIPLQNSNPYGYFPPSLKEKSANALPRGFLPSEAIPPPGSRSGMDAAVDALRNRVPGAGKGSRDGRIITTSEGYGQGFCIFYSDPTLFYRVASLVLFFTNIALTLYTLTVIMSHISEITKRQLIRDVCPPKPPCPAVKKRPGTPGPPRGYTPSPIRSVDDQKLSKSGGWTPSRNSDSRSPTRSQPSPARQAAGFSPAQSPPRPAPVQIGRKVSFNVMNDDEYSSSSEEPYESRR